MGREQECTTYSCTKEVTQKSSVKEHLLKKTADKRREKKRKR